MTEVTETEVKRIVTMNDGRAVDFKKRNNILQTIDTESNVVSFDIFTGESHSIDLSAIPSDIKELIFAKGVAAIIKANLAGVNLQDVNEETGIITNSLSAAVEKGIKALLDGKVSTRVSSDDGEVLSDEVKAFVVASTYEPSGFYKEGWAAATIEEGGLRLFNDETSAELLSEIAGVWDSLDRKARNAVRRNPYFALAQGYAFQHLLAQAA